VDADAHSTDENPFKAPQARLGPAALNAWVSPSGVAVRLVGSTWMRRQIELTVGDETYLVDYQALGNGERVFVNGVLAAHGGSVFRFAPRFDFRIGALPASLDVKVNIWTGKIRGLRLKLENELLYEEGALS
jgi:hypothetical protein